MNFQTKKIALFGTSADPPTSGHEIIIKELAEKYDMVITYASNNPSKEHQENLSNRSNLLKILIDNLNNSKIIFDANISSKWAIKTIKKCKAKYQTKSLEFVIGSDLIEEMFLWKNIDEIFKEAKLYIIPREGYELNPEHLEAITHLRGTFEISKLKVPNVSSSMARSDSNYSFLPKSLIPIVKNKNLYKHN